MNKFELHILGCGSALPTMQHAPTSQVLNIREKLFMIDCGEGTQLQFRRARLRFGRLNRIFISHLHGDHCFGLIGLISTLALLGRTGDLVIHAVAELETILRPQLNYFCRDLAFNVIIEPFDASKNQLIYSDRSIKVSTIPLDHRVACAGFLFEETPNDLHLDGAAIKFFNVPIKQLAAIKQGADCVLDDGTVIANHRLTKPADPVRKYAYCSDTAYNERIVPVVQGVDLLYHEATFLEEDKGRAKETRHSTAAQAARIAQLAGVKNLMLGHYSSRYTESELFKKEAKEVFEHVVLANELLVHEI
ncbi:MAG: hypothetical protein RL662_1622 [Bacteroidota bacterium]|jgi:ribonuclease Z